MVELKHLDDVGFAISGTSSLLRFAFLVTEEIVLRLV